MINLRNNMTEQFDRDGKINRNFLYGEFIFNGKTNDIGQIIGFYKTTDSNSSIKNARYFRVKSINTDETNWFVDTKDGEGNKHLFLLPKNDLMNII